MQSDYTDVYLLHVHLDSGGNMPEVEKREFVLPQINVQELCSCVRDTSDLSRQVFYLRRKLSWVFNVAEAANSPQMSTCSCLSPKSQSSHTDTLLNDCSSSSSSLLCCCRSCSWRSLTSVADPTVVLVIVAAELKLPMIRLLMCFYASVCDDQAADTHTHTHVRNWVMLKVVVYEFGRHYLSLRLYFRDFKVKAELFPLFHLHVCI